MVHTKEPVLPPIDGSVTIPESIEFHWKHNAELPIFVFNRDGSDEVTEISYLEFGRACHRVAHHVRPRREGKDGEVVAFIALADTIVYQAITVGLMRAGLVPFPISPRNTPAAVAHLLKKTSCHRLITTTVTLKSLVDGVKSELSTEDPTFELIVEDIPSLAELYPKIGKETVDDAFEPYPQYTVRPPMTDVAIYLHSSGSTGFPKAIPQTHLILTHWAAFPSLVEFRDHTPRVRIAGMPLPSFHTLGIYAQVLYTLVGMSSVGVYPPLVTSKELLPMMPTPDNILDHTRRTKSNAMITIPALLQIWAQTQDAVDLLKSLYFVGYSGGSVAPKLGDFMVAAGVKLNPGYGGTEFGSPTHAIPRKGDESEWAYMEFSPRSNVRWVPQGDGTYECQFLTTETHSLPIENLPDVRGYATSDLWEQHPTKKYLWKIVGRIDDVIIHSSSEKTVPAPMEDIVMSSRYVMGTVIFGRGHDQPGILIEPKPEYAIDVDDQVQLAALRNKLWSVIEEANKVAPAFSRIFKEMILITKKDKPLPRTGKGTVMRKMALKAYDEEIEALYATVESSAKGEDVIPPSSWTQHDVQMWLLEQAADIQPGKEFVPSTDVFEQGFDSLSATILRRRIVGALRSNKNADKGAATGQAAELVTQNTVYNYPTVESLSSFLENLVKDPTGFKDGNSGKVAIEKMIEKYGVGLDGALPTTVVTANGQANANGKVVLLTGSTGNLGSQILASLLEDPGVERVYALNRPSNGKAVLERQSERFLDKALDVGLLGSEKLVFVEGDIAVPGFGLVTKLYNEIRDSISVVIHNAWRLDFNLSLASFEPNVRGTRHLIDFVRSGPHAATTRFLFTSSVASAQGWDKETGPFPEEVNLDAAVAVGSGYGEGKYVAERLLAKSGLPVTSFRIGQISGGLPNGAWATSDWVPIFVKSSLALGALPSATGLVSWLPMHAVSKAILDVAFAKNQPPVALNLVHPRPVPWNAVILAVKEALRNHDPKVVPSREWFAMLEKRAGNASDADLETVVSRLLSALRCCRSAGDEITDAMLIIRRNFFSLTTQPAIKLLEFFRAIAHADEEITSASQTEAESGGLARFATAKSQSVSATMKELTPIGAEDAARWVAYWRGVGFF
ncbi:Non-canonical non-ribosomal peptide synthetase FUB8 [Hypsizygus marmoreus]|uniref:Non-canonical non-ribosomal peptide synthetase FUB8 n=1 Tax=Hypsizygus marmoreus TaxID=39966 RepID=A0A369JF13_HYPMA|nr:Non-canonical non-ribosomal peptide synthetase FUB8 [Hypsizygus marmoreus]